MSNTRQIGAVAFAEHGALDMRGLQLAPHRDRVAVGADDPLAHVEAAALLLAVAHDHHDVVVFRRLGEAVGLRRAVDQRVVVIALDELHAPGRGIEPDEPRIAGDEGFRECDQRGAFGRGLLDQRDRLVDGLVEIEEDGRRLHCGSLEFRMRDGHGKVSFSGAALPFYPCGNNRPGARFPACLGRAPDLD